jgi:hypothetical protein
MQNPCHEQCVCFFWFCGGEFLHLWIQEKIELWKKIAEILEKNQQNLETKKNVKLLKF